MRRSVPSVDPDVAAQPESDDTSKTARQRLANSAADAATNARPRNHRRADYAILVFIGMVLVAAVMTYVLRKGAPPPR